MALQSTSFFASFDITDGSQIRDISPILAEALYFDLTLLGALGTDMGQQAYDPTHYWNEDALNSDTAAVSGSVASNGTSVVLAAGQGARVHVGDLIVLMRSGADMVKQVTAISTDTLTVGASAYGSSTAVSIADGDSIAIVRAEQEGSDIGVDRSVAPSVKSNVTQILSAFDLMVTGSQLARRMATDQLQDWVAHQLANRAIEFKINLTRAQLYSESSASAGSDTAYRTMKGLYPWVRDNGNKTTAGTFSYSALNTANKTMIDKGVYADTLLIGTDLVAGSHGVATFDSSNRRLLESDRQVGYMVNEILLNHGNAAQVVIDARVRPGDAFLFDKSKFKPLPYNGRGLFTIAAVDFTDGKKRRILGEWTNECRHADAFAVFNGQS
jgi:uncharacterized protein DUF5309